jgi:hypothetical protein
VEGSGGGGGGGGRANLAGDSAWRENLARNSGRNSVWVVGKSGGGFW